MFKKKKTFFIFINSEPSDECYSFTVYGNVSFMYVYTFSSIKSKVRVSEYRWGFWISILDGIF